MAINKQSSNLSKDDSLFFENKKSDFYDKIFEDNFNNYNEVNFLIT